MKHKFLNLIFSLLAISCFGQIEISPKANEYLSIGTCITWDNYYTAGPRLSAEYVTRIKQKEKLFIGISFDNKWKTLNGIPSVKLQQGSEVPPELDFNHLSINLHSLSRMGKTKLMFDFSCGLGAIYLHGEGRHSFQPTINIGMIMNVKIAPKTFLEISPLFFIPPSKVIISPSWLTKSRSVYSAWHLMPLGLRFRLD